MSIEQLSDDEIVASLQNPGVIDLLPEPLRSQVARIILRNGNDFRDNLNPILPKVRPFFVFRVNGTSPPKQPPTAAKDLRSHLRQPGVIDSLPEPLRSQVRGILTGRCGSCETKELAKIAEEVTRALDQART